ncbi:MAG: M23 family metallopeptidase [Flavobacteriaceae bacterium]|nr:M23 family metallopeptidase [Candidatus Onthonaster equi]
MKVIKPLYVSLFLTTLAFGQRAEQPNADKYPKTDFINPLEIKNFLAGNFGELRSNHFHSGLDIKTQQKEGLRVLAAGDGYISRINISPTGYGNAIYIDHPNGYTTVYGHLQKFDDVIKEYVRKKQYEQKTFKIELYPEKNELKVTKGQLIALSGNSGGSGGPHLHFEIRDTKTEEPINPFYFGFDIPDTSKPSILGTYIYPIKGKANGATNRITVANGATINAAGQIGFGIKTYDKHNGAENNNGVHQIEVFVNDEPIYTYTASRFSFDETRAINSVCDYSDLMRNNSWVYQAFVKDGNPLRVFSNLQNNGILNVEAGQTYSVKIVSSDYAKNSSTVNFKINGITSTSEHIETPFSNPIYWNKENSFKSEGVEIFFPKGIFYEDFDLSYKKVGTKHHIGDWNFPVHQNFTIALDPSSDIPAAHLEKAIIVRQFQKKGAWKKSFENTELKNGKLIAKVREFGIFSIEIDYTKPTITPLNIKENSQFTKTNGKINFTISDSKSGIKEYNAYIDGKWILAEYDHKIKRLSIDLNAESIEIGEHQLELNVKDEKNNTSTFTTTFKKVS